jgi:hypothetical protein
MGTMGEIDGDVVDWSEPGYNVPSATDDERLAELAEQSERLAGRREPKRTVELLEDDVRYLVQENGELEAELDAWLKWYEEAPEVGDETAHWNSWYGRAPSRH